MNEDLWNEYLQNYYAEMCERLNTDIFYNVTTGTFDWSKKGINR